ncbi:hypothetical protein K490DRAFT_44215 [Saccharata proteae CBS 121410]|uniref:Uncharacterized protein n=1 Tax=Saccharata proteae CBS 121410 TaxID=1314787 RepID=A0A9P4HR64_9PEZI|nr:hypothetical protein K490DRAFT_44215 [Saccharata proteae CBS 121410]
MGTLTAGVPRLDEHCPHKLPSSCRLTARPVCCACQDTRPHCASYSVYVDGVGFVQRGTRWQGYCWFCREFWNNRVAASGLSPPQTRIPEEPDQTEFLDRWYDFHRGYRILTTDDGTEILMDVSGEPLHGVAPGCLPRTLEELRTGRPAALGLSSAPRQTQASAGAPEGPSESIEDTIGALLDEANAEDAERRDVMNRHLPAMSTADPSGSPSSTAGPSQPPRHTTVQDRRERYMTEDYARVFGTREEMESQGEDYYSPISGMFNRAWDRYRRAEEQRRNPDGPDPDVSVAALNQTSEVFENEVPDPSLVC